MNSPVSTKTCKTCNDTKKTQTQFVIAFSHDDRNNMFVRTVARGGPSFTFRSLRKRFESHQVVVVIVMGPDRLLFSGLALNARLRRRRRRRRRLCGFKKLSLLNFSRLFSPP